MGDDDEDRTIRVLSICCQPSVISQLVDIGGNSNQLGHVKFLSFVRDLDCLQPKGNRLRRKSINAFKERRYVAVSYTWIPSEHEDNITGRYAVEDWDGNSFQPSKVRRSVFDRILLYMRHANIQLLWIDAHCIDQETCGANDCSRHIRCAKKRHAVQAMDLVYKLSNHPVALLGWKLSTGFQLCLFARLLSGNLVRGGEDNRATSRLSPASDINEAVAALYLLHEMTQDRRWERAWTFQENYRGGPRMRLLIRHSAFLEAQKLQHRVFGDIPGELCIWSVAFSTEATRLCLMLRGVADMLLPYDLRRIDSVLHAAGRYVLMLPTLKCMTPVVIHDIETRELSESWDRLALVANCCQYPVRLDGDVLRRQRYSLSLSVLAMCLLNGEILDNGENQITLRPGLTASEYLNGLIFQAFNAPEDDTRRLTFNKGCRLTDVELTPTGITARGHVWKLGAVIDTSRFSRKLPWIDEPRGRLTLVQRKHFYQLVIYLDGSHHKLLAKKMNDYLVTDANADANFASFTDMYLYRMASELATAIQRRQKLRLATIWNPTGQFAPYRAIFIGSHQDGNVTSPSSSTFVFTSARQGDPGSESHDANDIDRHVSLAVGLEEPLNRSSMPQLRTRRWLHGICFFDECPRTKVIFPWPHALKTL